MAKPKIKTEKILAVIEDGKGTLLVERKMSDGKAYGTMQTFVVTGGSLSTLNQAIYSARGELDMKNAKAPAVKDVTLGDNTPDDEDETDTSDDETIEEEPGENEVDDDRTEHERESQELLRQALDTFDGDGSLPAATTDEPDADGWKQPTLF